MALQSEGSSKKRLCAADQRGDADDATLGLALGCDTETAAKRLRTDDAEGEDVQQGDVAALEHGDADVVEYDGQGGGAALEHGDAADVVEHDGQGGGAAAEHDSQHDGSRISTLFPDLRRLIVSRLPLKYAIRMEVQSRAWRDLWKNLDQPHPSILVLELKGHGTMSPQQLLELLTKRAEDILGGEAPRLASVSLVITHSAMRCELLKNCLRLLAGGCAVEDLQIELREPTNLQKVLFHFSLVASSRRLARLSLRGVNFSGIHLNGMNHPFSTVEVIQLHDVGISIIILVRVLRRCPDLRVLDLRDCRGVVWFTMNRDLRCITTIDIMDNPSLTRLTVLGCNNVTRINVAALSRLTSLHYSGSFLNTLYLPRSASLTDLSICCHMRIKNALFTDLVNSNLLPTSRLSVLTICSNALQHLCNLSTTGAHADLNQLTELQLVMFDMEPDNLSDICDFLDAYPFPMLKRLFVQLPKVCKEESMVIHVPPETVLENLEVVKITNSNRNLVHLVSFLLRKASSLRKILVPNSPVVREQVRLLLNNDFLHDEMIICDDDDAIEPFHISMVQYERTRQRAASSSM